VTGLSGLLGSGSLAGADVGSGWQTQCAARHNHECVCRRLPCAALRSRPTGERGSYPRQLADRCNGGPLLEQVAVTRVDNLSVLVITGLARGLAMAASGL